MGAIVAVLALSAVPTLSTPKDAVAWVVAAQGTRSAADRKFDRYVYFRDWHGADEIAAVRLAANIAANRSNEVHPGQLYAGGKLIRFDLREFAPKAEDLIEVLAAWEKLADEGDLHARLIESKVVIRKSTKRGGKPTKKIIRKVTPVYRPDEPELTALMIGASSSNAVLIRAEIFVERVLSTVDGGIYYPLAGIKKSDPEGVKNRKTAWEKFTDSLGVDEKESADLDGDQRAAIFESDVAGDKARQMIGVRQRLGRGVGGTFTWTEDIREDQRKKARDHAIRTLLNFQGAAREAIGLKRDGLCIFGLFDAKGELQNSVPDDIATDHEIPAPYTQRLQGALSCIRCHGREDGYRKVRNDVIEMTKSGRYQIGGDLSKSLGLSQREITDRLKGQYGGDFDERIQLCRDEYSAAVFRCTLGYSVPDASAAIAGIVASYRYQSVGAAIACKELGYVVDDKDAVGVLCDIVPDLPKDKSGVSPEDPVIIRLKTNGKVPREDFEQVYGDLVSRNLEYRRKQPAKNDGASLQKWRVAA